VKKSGAWFTYEGEQLGQGRENAKQFLTENLDLMVEISDKIRHAVGIEDVPEGDAQARTDADAAEADADAEPLEIEG
jgi:recombination protein RecA